MRPAFAVQYYVAAQIQMHTHTHIITCTYIDYIIYIYLHKYIYMSRVSVHIHIYLHFYPQTHTHTHTNIARALSRTLLGDVRSAGSKADKQKCACYAKNAFRSNMHVSPVRT